MKKRTDEQLVELASKGKKQAFSELYKRYIKKVYYQVSCRVRDRQTAEDITSEIFIAVLSSLGNFNEEYKVSTWVSAITRHKLSDHFRKVYKVELSSYDDNILGSEDIEEEFNIDDEGRVGKLIEDLSDREKDIVKKRYLQNMPMKQISEELNLTESNIKVIHHRAIKKLREKYCKENE